MKKITLFWFRRDLRLEDNAGLFHALKSQHPVQPIFIFDKDILKLLPKNDARVDFIQQEVIRLSKELESFGASIDVRLGKPIEIWQQLIKDYNIDRVVANRDYEPYAQKRDKEVYELLKHHHIEFIGKKDQVIFEKKEVVKADGSPYAVYTPYSKLWKSKLNDFYLKPYPSEKIDHWHQSKGNKVPSLEDLGFKKSSISIPKREINKKVIRNYHDTRDLPAVAGTSRLSIHLRFGTISIRKLTSIALKTNEKYLNELIWRDFYTMILWHFPEVVNRNYNKKYDLIQWRNNEEEFEKWCNGNTGYPIVDAGMRELNSTGFMHNRVRMIVASFLTKHLLIDWKWGEAYFAEKLLDFELASNNGGWQWAAGTGVDAAPYFRVFNPYLQTDRFDKEGLYVKKWVPEVNSPNYPSPIVDHKHARQRALDTYKSGIEASI